MDYTIKHKPETSRFETTVDGYTGYIEYRSGDGKLHILHTIVPMKIEGRGIAAALTRAVFEYAKENGLKVVPICSYADTWCRRHPEYMDIVHEN